MSASGMRMPAAIAWAFFVPGALFIVASIVRLQVDGLTLMGAVFLVIWFWLAGGFTREFWVQDPAPAERWEDLLEQEEIR